MAEHLSDEEQLENLKRWWKENGLFTVAAIVFVAGGYFGWEFWTEGKKENAEAASAIYQKMMIAADVEPGQRPSSDEQVTIATLASQLRTEFSDSQYARYGALLLAKLAVEKDDLDTAAEQLGWVLENADEGLHYVTTLRLAKVEAARGNIDLAISMLNDWAEAKTFTSAYAEARGDFYMMKGDTVLAHESYEQALKHMTDVDARLRPVLELKLNQVAPTSELTDNGQAMDAGGA